jgi:uncharacterized membrane protein
MPHVLLVWPLLFLTSLAGGLSIVIAARTSGVARLPGCGQGSGCAALAASRWSQWLIVPVAALGAGTYLLLGVALLLTNIRPPSTSDVLFQVIASLSMLAIGAAAWFLFLQLVVVRQACIYCNLVHLMGLAIFAIIMFSAVHGDLAVGTNGVLTWTGKPMLAGLSGLLLLVGGQLLWRPKSYAIIPSDRAAGSCASSQHEFSTVPASSMLEALEPTRQSVALSAVTRPAREVSLLNGRIRLSTNDWPIVGSADARHLIAILFDYTCPTCRVVHQMVNDLLDQDRRWLGVLILPVPQNPSCNPNVTRIHPGRGQACQFARLALAVWQSRPDRYEDFESYLFATEEVPLLGLAMQKASELTGARIDPHRPDDQFDQIIRRSVEVYKAAGVEKIPTLLLPNAFVAGQFPSVAELRAVLNGEFSKSGQ